MTDTHNPHTGPTRSPARAIGRNAIAPLTRLALATALLTLLFQLGRDDTLLNAAGGGAASATRNLLTSAHDFAAAVGSSTQAADMTGMVAFLIVIAAAIPASFLALRAPQQERWQRAVTLLGNTTRPVLRWYLAFTIAAAIITGQAGTHPAVLSVDGAISVTIYTLILAVLAYPDQAVNVSKAVAVSISRRSQHRRPTPAA
ncbi:hypothetical protein [Prescottella subtropica]|uniref:hypothetical protein n=1 Tax=Prescottella subtropica TaxID=2545757 RepID=UPI0010F4D4DF|nr:hypothetical protein [Prescottella subtropica]